MKTLIVILKIILMLGLVCLMFSPIISEYMSFRRDRKNKITHKRFRLVVFSFLYFVAITAVMVLLKDLALWIGSWSAVTWLTNRISIPGRVNYAVAVFAVMLINLIIGLIFKLLLNLVRIGLKKKDLVTPRGKDGEYTLFQKLERKILEFFNNETGFL